MHIPGERAWRRLQVPRGPRATRSGGVLLSGQVMVTAADRSSFRWGTSKVEMPNFYDRLGYQSKEESYTLLPERRDRPCSSQAFHLTPAVILVPAPVFAVVIVSSAWSQLLNQRPEISHWQPQVAQRFPLVLCIWAVIIISTVITAASGGSGPEWHFVVLGTAQKGKGCQC